MDAPSIETWHIVIAGHLQNQGQLVGMTRLWWDLYQAHVGTRTAVLFREWDCDVETLAERIWRFRGNGDGPRICLYGYSWGGMTAILLARALADRGLKVAYLVLSDAVYRHRYRLGNWRTLCHWIPIRIPANVGSVHAFRQRVSWPRGHDLLLANGKPPENIRYIKVTHTYMDDARAFKNCALDLAAANQ